MGISFNGVAIAAQNQQKKLLHAFSRVVERGVFLNGPESAQFETRLARFLGKKTIISVASGHDALLLSLIALRLPPESEIIIPANAYPTAFPVALSGLKPIFVDVNTHGQLDPIDVSHSITKRTRVIIMVHLYGLIGDLIAIKRLCTKHHILLIEDVAQAFGGEWSRKKVGTIGDIGCFSFYPTKNLAALGDGGAIWTQNTLLQRRIIEAKLYGERIRYQSRWVAGHSRLPELQAAALSVYLDSFPTEIQKRRQVFSWYHHAWTSFGLSPFGYILKSHPKSNPVPHLLVVSVRNRNALQRFLTRHTIPTIIHYPHPLNKIQAFEKFIPPHRVFPNAEKLASRVVSLPFHPFMRKSEVTHVVQTIKQFYQAHPTD